MGQIKVKRTILQRGISALLNKVHFRYFSDEFYIRLMYWGRCGKILNLDSPKTFNEKIQWLKLNYHDPRMPFLVDKYEVKRIVGKIIGEEYIIPTLGVWDRFSDIDFSSLPDAFVLKTTHDSGGVVFCKTKSDFDYDKAREIINQSLNSNYYYHGREWPYKSVKPRIIAEPYLVDESGIELKDYKIFNFNGDPTIIQVDFDRFVDHKRNIYDIEWNLIDAMIQYPSSPDTIIKKPEKLQLLLSLSRVLAKDFPHVRTDFYTFGEKIYFGEMTFFHGGGFEYFVPSSFDEKMGECLRLPIEGE